jgi:hypothetical protein
MPRRNDRNGRTRPGLRASPMPACRHRRIATDRLLGGPPKNPVTPPGILYRPEDETPRTDERDRVTAIGVRSCYQREDARSPLSAGRTHGSIDSGGRATSAARWLRYGMDMRCRVVGQARRGRPIGLVRPSSPTGRGAASSKPNWRGMPFPSGDSREHRPAPGERLRTAEGQPVTESQSP